MFPVWLIEFTVYAVTYLTVPAIWETWLAASKTHNFYFQVLYGNFPQNTQSSQSSNAAVMQLLQSSMP